MRIMGLKYILKILFVLVLLGIFFVDLKYNLENYQLVNASLTPSSKFWLGTDNLGRDLFSLILSIIKETILPLWVIVFLGSGVGVIFGVLLILNNQSSSWVQFVCTTFYNLSKMVLYLPITFLVFTFAVWVGKFDDKSLFLLIGLIVAIGFCHELVCLYKEDKELEYWKAHKALGGSEFFRILHYGILGRWKQSLRCILVFYLQIVLIAECSLSYLGFGVIEPSPSFGNILSAHYSEIIRGRSNVSLVIALSMVFCLWVPQWLLEDVKE